MTDRELSPAFKEWATHEYGKLFWIRNDFTALCLQDAYCAGLLAGRSMGSAMAPTAAELEEYRTAKRADEIMRAVRPYKERTGCSPAEAKAAFDAAIGDKP